MYLEQFAGSQRYFTSVAPARSADEALKRLQADDVSLVLEIPPSFGKDFRRGSEPEVAAQVDGAMTFRGDTVEQYVQGVHNTALAGPGERPCDEPATQAHGRHRRALHVQPDVRERVLDRAERAGAAPAPDPGDSHDGEHRAREGARLDDQLLRHAHGQARVPGGQAAPVHRDRHAQLLHPDRAGDHRLQRADQGQLLDADALHAALRDGDDRHRHGHLDVHQQPGRRRVRHGDPHHRAHDSVLRPAAAGLDAARAAPVSSVRSGPPLTTCTPAWARTPRASGRA